MSIAPRRSLYGKLSGDVTLSGMLGTAADGYTKAIYYGVAPDNAEFPYVVLAKLSGTPRYALGERAFDNEVWLVKAVDRNTTADRAEAIAARIDELLTDGSVSISGSTQLYLRRESDMDFTEEQDGEVFYHAGAQYRFIYD